MLSGFSGSLRSRRMLSQISSMSLSRAWTSSFKSSSVTAMSRGYHGGRAHLFARSDRVDRGRRGGLEDHAAVEHRAVDQAGVGRRRIAGDGRGGVGGLAAGLLGGEQLERAQRLLERAGVGGARVAGRRG